MRSTNICRRQSPSSEPELEQSVLAILYILTGKLKPLCRSCAINISSFDFIPKSLLNLEYPLLFLTNSLRSVPDSSAVIGFNQIPRVIQDQVYLVILLNRYSPKSILINFN